MQLWMAPTGVGGSGHHVRVRKPSDLPSELAKPAFGVRRALDLGVTPTRLRARDLTAPFHGIRASERASSQPELCEQYFPRLRDDQFFSHVTAAILHGVPLPRELYLRRQLDVSGRVNRPRTRGVIGHRQATTPVVTIRGLPVTHPAWLLAELAAELSADDLVVAGDSLVRRKYPKTSIEELREVLQRTHGSGVRRARAALASIRSGTDSPMETRLRLLIVRAGLPEPVIGHVVYSKHGDYVGRPDLAYPDEKVAIEYEGDHHRTDPRVFADDIERREQMQEADWYVIRVVSSHVYRWPVWLADRIARVLADRG
jgi:hypothetical protein